MPEIGEVARVVHFLSKNLVGRRVLSVLTQEDDIVYGKVGCSATAFATALKGKTVVGARQQGKYFWLEMSAPPHPLMHLGMTGWVKLSNEDSYYYKGSNAKKEPEGGPEWPPKYWKFVLKMEGEPACEAAFVDSRRLARIRLIDVPAGEMRNTTPLKENGPDPVIDKDVLTVDWLRNKVLGKKVPIKALLLDQGNISGVGNWVADEVLFNARIHPEQYSNTFSDVQVAQLHKSLMYVCDFACEVLSDSSKFPEGWLFKHRWGKGRRKNGHFLANGDKIVHLTVGGRTSAIVPSVQKKTGPVAGDVASGEEDEDGDVLEESEEIEEEQEKEDKKARPKRKTATPKKSAEAGERDTKAKANARARPTSTPPNISRKRTPKKKAELKEEEEEEEEAEVKDEDEDEDEPTATKPRSRKRKSTTATSTPRSGKKVKAKSTKQTPDTTNGTGRRRSARLSGQ